MKYIKTSLSMMLSFVTAGGLTHGTENTELLGYWDGFTAVGVATEGILTIDVKQNLTGGVLRLTQGTVEERPSIDLSGIDNLSLYNGITVSLQLHDAGPDKGHFIGMASQETPTLFAAGTDDAGKPHFFFTGSASNVIQENTNTAPLLINGNTPVVITVTAGYNSTTNTVQFHMYQNGQLVHSGTAQDNTQHHIVALTAAQQELDTLVLGGWASESTNNRLTATVERMEILQGTLSAAGAYQRYTEWTALQTVPEPASACLGLLGIGSLMLRRRR